MSSLPGSGCIAKLNAFQHGTRSRALSVEDNRALDLVRKALKIDDLFFLIMVR